MRGPAPVIAIAVLSFLAYAAALGHAPVWDDRIHVLDNPAVEEARWREILGRPTGSYHRPVVFTTFAIERAWLGAPPAAMRFTNVALHAATACLLFLAAARLGAPRNAAAAGALLFALHPLQSEAVTYISGRTDLLAALFSLLALLLHARWRRWRAAPAGAARSARPAALAGALGCYLLAILSKESAASLPLALLAGDALFRRPPAPPPPPAGAAPGPRRLSLLAGAVPYAAILALYALYRLGLPGDRLQVSLLAGLPARLPAALAALGAYAKLLAFPVNLHLERFVPADAAAAAVTGAVLILAGLAAFLRGGPQARFWIAWAAAAYLPVANLVPVYPGLPADMVFAPEHFLYVPSMGVIMALAPALAGRLRAGAGAALLAAVALCFTLGLQDRNRDWRDEETLYRHTLRFSPGSARVALNLGNLYFERGDAAAAARVWNAALRRNPGDPDLLTNAGLAALRMGRLPEAQRLLERAAASDPGDAQAWANLGAVYATGGHIADARRAYGRALALDGRNADARAGMARLEGRGPGRR